MAGPSTSQALTNVEQMEVLYTILDEESISDISLDNDSVFDIDYTQLVTPGTHVISESDSDETQEEIVQVELGGVSSTFVWENIDSFPSSQKTFCNVYGPQFNTAELDVVSALENIFDIALVQLIVDETNRKYRKVSDLSHFTLGFGNGKMLQSKKCTWFWL
jgi:hypothetical protein